MLALSVIIIIGLIAQFSVAQGKFFNKQILFALFGISVFYLGYILPTDILKKICWFIYGIAVLLLLIVLVKGTSALGAQRWLSIGGFSLQPSEAAKIACIIALANWLTEHKANSIFNIISTGFIILLLPFGLIFIQPDLGTSMVLIAVFLSMCYWGGASLAQIIGLISPLLLLISSALGEKAFILASFKFREHLIQLDCSILGIICILALSIYFANHYKVWKKNIKVLFLGLYILFCLFISVVGRPVAWGILAPYQQKRLTIFIDPSVDPQGAGYNIIQSLIAVGSGGLYGAGFRQGRLTQGQFVPEQHTDFIFSSIAEEWGFIGVLVLLIAFLIVCVRLLILAKDLENDFSQLLIVGILAFLCFHVCVNIGMNIGLMPVTGVPLPLISYGGTSMWITLFSLGITQRIYADNSPISNR
jgi:rod shape determining protein RodA